MAKDTAEKNLMLELCFEMIRRDCGPDYGEKLCTKIHDRLISLTGTIDDRGSESVRHHINDNILPVVSIYQILQESELSKEDAYTRTAGWMHEIAEQRAATFCKMARMPFFYSFFSHICPGFMKKNYPIEGWDMRFNRRDRVETAFDCYRCVYLDVTTELGCPELCIAFCENDDISYGAMKPKVHFIRTKTLADGGDCCDFRLVNGKYLNRL